MKKKIAQYVRDISIFQKMLVGCILVTILVSLLSGGLTYSISSRIILNKTIDQTEEIINQVSENYDSFMEVINNRLDYIAFNPTVQEELNNGVPEEEEEGYYSGSRVVKRLLVQMFKSNQMKDIQIYGGNGKNYFCTVTGVEAPQLENEERLKEVARENIGALVYVNDIQASECLQVVKEIRDNLLMEPLGVLRTGIRITALERIQNNVNFASSGTILLLDSENQIIVGEKCELTEKAESLFTKWNDSFKYVMEGQRYQVIYQVSDYTGFKTIGIIPEKEITVAIRPVQLVTMVSLAAGVILSIFLSIIMSRFMGKPVKNTVNALKKVSQGDFAVRLEGERKDEFGEINREFNHTLEHMERLLEEITQSKILNKEMEFKALQAQINPHFLYNALDTVNWMARRKDEEDICEMISAVSNLLRISINNREVMFTVKKELQYVKDYLYIQQTRYRNRFDVEIKVEEEIESQMLPKLTIQPLVENAIVHSVEISKEKAVLKITARRVKEEVCITIEDNGVGISEEVLRNLLKPPKEKVDIKTAHTGLGVYAVHQRLQYMFGEEYGLNINSVVGHGTCITIHIPYEQDELKIKERAEKLYRRRD